MGARRTPLVYGVAAIAYVTIGVFYPTFLFSWVVAAGYLLLVVWIVPALARRLLR